MRHPPSRVGTLSDLPSTSLGLICVAKEVGPQPHSVAALNTPVAPMSVMSVEGVITDLS